MGLLARFQTPSACLLQGTAAATDGMHCSGWQCSFAVLLTVQTRCGSRPAGRNKTTAQLVPAQREKAGAASPRVRNCIEIVKPFQQNEPMDRAGRSASEAIFSPAETARFDCEPQRADFLAGAALCEPRSADFAAGAALCEPRSAVFVPGAALCEPRSADFVAVAAL